MITRREFIATTMAAAGSLTIGSGQTSATPGKQDMTDKAEAPRIRRARLSGPEHVTKDATVAEMGADGTMTVLSKGTNEGVCTPGNENKIGDPPRGIHP